MRMRRTVEGKWVKDKVGRSTIEGKGVNDEVG
jgi:hypothetical protein